MGSRKKSTYASSTTLAQKGAGELLHLLSNWVSLWRCPLHFFSSGRGLACGDNIMCCSDSQWHAHPPISFDHASARSKVLHRVVDNTPRVNRLNNECNAP